MRTGLRKQKIWWLQNFHFFCKRQTQIFVLVRTGPNYISTVNGPNSTSCHVKLILVTPLRSKTRKLGAFGSYIPTSCSKTWLERNVFQSQNSHLRNTECVKSVALEGGLIFRRSLAWDEVLQPACCCFELKVTGFHLALVFTASLSEVGNGVKTCQIWKTQTQLICCIEDFKVFAGNWTLVLCERNHSLSRKIFQWWI